MNLDLEELNRTELIHIAHDMGAFDAHRGMSIPELCAKIRKPPVNPNLMSRPVHKNRLRIMTYVESVWDQVHSTIQGCPARTRSPTACFTCTDHQVGLCILQNLESFENVVLPEKVQMTTKDFQPRTSAEWTALATSAEPQSRVIVTAALTSLGVKALDIAKELKTPEARVAKIMELQAERFPDFSGGGKAKGPAPKASAGAGTKTVASTASASTGGAASGGNVAKLEKELAELREQFEALQEYVLEAHVFSRALCVTFGVDESLFEMKGELALQSDEGNG